jgi:diamine N-acetyltransferase
VEIYLKDIDSSSWRDCIQLEVKEEQRPFIQSNLHSIAESRFQNGMRLLGIYKDHIMVGLLLIFWMKMEI